MIFCSALTYDTQRSLAEYADSEKSEDISDMKSGLEENDTSFDSSDSVELELGRIGGIHLVLYV